jgi:hypothetical protein
MSIYAMTAARVARTAPRRGGAPRFGPDLRGNDSVGSPAAQRNDVLGQLLLHTPTEIVALYVAVVSFLPAIPAPGKVRPIWAYDFTPRWIVFLICVALTPVTVFVAQRVRYRGAHQTFTWPVLEMSLATVAFAAWAIALPLSPLYSWHSWKAWIGTVIAAFVLYIIGLLGKALGKPLLEPAST